MGTAFFIFILLFVSACNQTPDEEQIEQILSEMIGAIENGKPAELSKHLHKSFMANRSMDVQQVKQMLIMYGMRHTKISVSRISTKTVLNPVYTDKAETTMSIVITGASAAHGLPDDGSVRTVKLEWLKDGDWLLLRASWE